MQVLIQQTCSLDTLVRIHVSWSRLQARRSCQRSGNTAKPLVLLVVGVADTEHGHLDCAEGIIPHEPCAQLHHRLVLALGCRVVSVDAQRSRHRVADPCQAVCTPEMFQNRAAVFGAQRFCNFRRAVCVLSSVFCTMHPVNGVLFALRSVVLRGLCSEFFACVPCLLSVFSALCSELVLAWQ